MAKGYFEISADQIRSLNDVGLMELCSRLFAAEAAKCDVPIKDINVTSEIKAPDDGLDACTPAHASSRTWLPSVETCWQLKSGSNGAPAKLAGETKKKYPSEFLQAGKAYIVIASDASGETGRRKRLKTLTEEAQAHGLPTDKINVYVAEQLVNWCNTLYGVAAWFLKNDNVPIPFEIWEKSRLFRNEYYKDHKNEAILNQLVNDLNSSESAFLHVHIEGLPGVGKSRMALEACRRSKFRDLTIFCPTLEVGALPALNRMLKDNDIHGTLVVDECSRDDAKKINGMGAMVSGRLRIITIGKPVRMERVRSIGLKPLQNYAMSKFVTDQVQGLPIEQANFVAEVSGGYFKFAQIIIRLIERDPAIDVTAILKDQEILDHMAELLEGLTNPDHLFVLAIFEQIGWEKELELEGELVAETLGFNWDEVRETTRKAELNMAIAPPAGRYRSISPDPLANLLAIQAWQKHHSVLNELFDKLPSESCKLSFLGRLRKISTHPTAKTFIANELKKKLTQLKDLNTTQIKMLRTMSSYDPEFVAKSVFYFLTNQNISERLLILGDRRREFVWLLEDLAWRKKCFSDAALALAELAISENESYANNATGTFISRFNVILGGTASPYPERLPVLDRLLERSDTSFRHLAIKALGAANNAHASRAAALKDEGTHALEPEWLPSVKESLDCRGLAIQKLISIIEQKFKGDEIILLPIIDQFIWPWCSSAIKEQVAQLAISMSEHFPETRRDIRAMVIKTLKNLERREDGNAMDFLNDLRDKLFTNDLSDLLFDVAGQTDESRPTSDIENLANALILDPSIVQAHLPWLLSGSAQNSWQVGEVLGKCDRNGVFMGIVQAASGLGEDRRFLCAYLLNTISQEGGIDAIITKLMRGGLAEQDLALDLIWRSGDINKYLNEVVALIDADTVSKARFAVLKFGQWYFHTDPSLLIPLLDRCLRLRELNEVAVTILDKKFEDGFPETLVNLALRACTTIDVITGGTMTSFHWKNLSLRFLPKYSFEICDAIFRAHAVTDGWFIQHDEASGIVYSVFEQSPGDGWRALLPHLEDESAYTFLIGFPRGLANRVSNNVLMTWIEENPERRVSYAVKLLGCGLGDESITADILEKWPNNKRIHDTLFGEMVSGVRMGPISESWKGEAEHLEKISKVTKRKGIKAFAVSAAKSFREMEHREKMREDEENLLDD